MDKAMKMSIPALLCVMIVAVPSVWATWVEDGIPLTEAVEYQTMPQIISDGEGGTIAVWVDFRNGDNDIYAQRADATGTILWATDGVPVCIVGLTQTSPRLTSDGAGGAIVTWEDRRVPAHSAIRAQRIDASGVARWTAGGILLCPEEAGVDPRIISDNFGGAIVTWADSRGADYDIYVQRLDPDGNAMWAADGVLLCGAIGTQYLPQLTTDGGSGAIIAWQDSRSGNTDIYAQRIKALGTIQWTTDGVLICSASGIQINPEIISDEAGGAIIAWVDDRSGTYDIYAHRVDFEGTLDWKTTDGVPICTATGPQSGPRMTSDGAGGAIISWIDSRTLNSDIYVQHITVAGSVQWTADGVPLCTATGSQADIAMISDGSGGAIAAWEDNRSINDIYVQHIDASGTVQWTEDGYPLCDETGNQQYPTAATDGAGGMIVAWADDRAGTKDIYALQIDARGRVAYHPPVIHSVFDVPGDEGGRVNLTWDASPVDYHVGAITEYTVWRNIEAPAAATMVAGGAKIVSSPSAVLQTETLDRDDDILRLAPLNGQAVYWELVYTQPAFHFEGYAVAIETLFDSTAVCDDYHYFQVVAHTSDSWVYYISEPDSGYSVDDLSPCPPVMVEGQQLYDPEGLSISWLHDGQPDVGYYRVYRGTDELFVPDPGNLLDEPASTEYLDESWDWSGDYYYKISAVDIHGNESDFALLRPAEITGEDIPGTPEAAYLSQNYPNPFNPATTIAFGLTSASRVSLKVYDSTGRLVRVVLDGDRAAGHYREQWDGLNSSGEPAASGVYFYRLVSQGLDETSKMILLR